MASRSLADLHPELHHRVEPWLLLCRDHDLDILIYCTMRSREEQAMLYRRNRSRKQIEWGYRRLQALGLNRDAQVLHDAPPQPGSSGRKVTNALPGLSYHQPHTLDRNYGSLALDFVPLVGGKAGWREDGQYALAGKLAEELGLTWSGRWSSFRETAHVQYDREGEIKAIPLALGEFA